MGGLGEERGQRVRLTHFYHVFADGDWVKPAQEHLKALLTSELFPELESVRLGIVGSRENRLKISETLPGVVVAEADAGWEQVTLQNLHDFCQTDDGAVFYAHTKGAWSNSELADRWRASMTHDTVTRWRECVEHLETVQACGPHWMRSLMPEHREHEYFFGGNFWWARSDYVRTLDPVKTNTRFQAEGWIGLNNPSVTNLRIGEPTSSNFCEAS
jgi:hypothetical protein